MYSERFCFTVMIVRLTFFVCRQYVEIMARILVVDDEKVIREGAAKVIMTCMPNAEIVQCEGPTEALETVEAKTFDVAFLDIEMPGMTGVELAKKIKKISPDTNIIFSTAYPQFAGEAFAIHASGYVTKPLTVEKVSQELDNLRRPIDDEDRGLRVQAFGNFEVFYDGKPLRFKYTKTKEMLAYLVDRNCAVVDIGEIKSTLWDDDEDRSSYIKQLRKDLMDTLKEVGAQDAVVVMRGGIGVIPSKVKCDFFDYLAGEPKGINSYHGEYMQQYSWAEVTHGSLEMRGNE